MASRFSMAELSLLALTQPIVGWRRTLGVEPFTEERQIVVPMSDTHRRTAIGTIGTYSSRIPNAMSIHAHASILHQFQDPSNGKWVALPRLGNSAQLREVTYLECEGVLGPDGGGLGGHLKRKRCRETMP